MLDLCKYKDILGKPNEGLRKIRIFDIAVSDTVIVIFCAWAISAFFKQPFWLTLVIIFISINSNEYE